MNKQIIIFIIVLLVVAGCSFYGGMLYKGSRTSQRAIGQGTRNGGQFANGNSFVTGDIISKDNQSITIKTRDGSSRIIFYSDTTEVGKFITGSSSDIEIGKSVMINGKTGSDGSITAQSIQIKPAQPVNQPTNK